MRYFFLTLTCLCCFFFHGISQSRFYGRVVAAGSGEPLTGATILAQTNQVSVMTDDNGEFSLLLSSLPDSLSVSFLGYGQRTVAINDEADSILFFRLPILDNQLTEVVVNTGYGRLPLDRATGSFSYVGLETLQRSAAPDLLSRLEGVANGLQFSRTGAVGESSSSPELRIRGLATIESNQAPLIVLDNFPYEGDLNTINPEDIASVTVLRDAAAASIWGARAGNGVLVITIKSGSISERPRFSFTVNNTWGEKPDLMRNPSWLSAETVMEIERTLFDAGAYVEDAATPIPLYAELLMKYRDNLIDESTLSAIEDQMKGTDLRREALKYLYQPSANRQYALNASGGGKTFGYYASLGYNDNEANIIGNRSKRLTFNSRNDFRPSERLEIIASIWLSTLAQQSNGIPMTGLRYIGSQPLSPYLALKDDNGNSLPGVYERRFAYYDQAENVGLLDWHFRPLDEMRLRDNSNNADEYRLSGRLKYRFFPAVNMEASYQYVQNRTAATSFYDADSYYVRNLVNRFTQADGAKIISDADIMSGGLSATDRNHAGRLQLNVNHTFNENHLISSLAGVELRQRTVSSYPGYTIYGYSKDFLTGTAQFDYLENYTTNPDGARARIPQPDAFRGEIIERYLSYFANASYTYASRHVLSGSLRWDASNLFGVKANQRGVPLWSAGWSWDASKEPFFDSSIINRLRLRTTYGASGNVNPTVSVFPTVIFQTDGRTQLPAANINSAGNPALQWEKVRTLNVGIDVAAWENRLALTVEYYMKSASDLIGEDFLDPTTGIIEDGRIQYKINYANMVSRGMDVQLASDWSFGDLRWTTAVLASLVRNRVTEYSAADVRNILDFVANPPAEVGRSRDVMYAIPWFGLDAETGQQLVRLAGNYSTDHEQFIRGATPADLTQMGVQVPTRYGSIRNTFRFRGIGIDAMLAYNGGHVFRVASQGPGEEYQGVYHQDYYRRWRQPGDERYTNVPAAIAPGVSNFYSKDAYKYAEVLVRRGDNIRLQDVNVSYTFPQKWVGKLRISNLRCYIYARNLGIIWKAANGPTDPDYPNAYYPTPRSYALGLQLDF